MARTRIIALSLALGCAALGAGFPLVPAPAAAATVSKLGDLTPFRTIVVDVAALVDKLKNEAKVI